MSEHSTDCDRVPTHPSDGDTFACRGCDYTAEFVILPGELGEWVDTSPTVIASAETQETPATHEG